jgi:hypothetical protein
MGRCVRHWGPTHDRFQEYNCLGQSAQQAGRRMPTQRILHFVHKCGNVTHLCYDLLSPIPNSQKTITCVIPVGVVSPPSSRGKFSFMPTGIPPDIFAPTEMASNHFQLFDEENSIVIMSATFNFKTLGKSCTRDVQLFT